LDAATFTWTNSSGAWSNPANWSPNGVPGATDSATVTNGSPAITNATTLSTLNLGGGTLTANGAGSLTIAAAFNFTNGIFKGALAINSGAVMTLSNSANGGNLDMPGASIVNNGTVIWAEGTLRGDSGLVITNNGSWLVQTDNQFNNAYGGTPVFNNFGTFTKSSTTNTTLFQGVTFNNSGPLTILSGILALNGAGNVTGSVVASNRTQINFYNGGVLNAAFTTLTNASVTFAGGFFTNGSALSFTGPGTNALTQNGNLTLIDTVPQNLSLFGGSLYLGPAFQSAGAITNLTLSGTSLYGTNTLVGTLNWIAGAINGTFNITLTGLLDLNGSANLSQTAAMTNSGHILWNGASPWTLSGSSILNNLPSGIFDIQCNSTLNSSGNPAFLNAGLIRKSLSPGVSTIAVNFTNTGTVSLQSGGINFVNPGSFGGSFIAINGTQFGFYNGGTLSGTFTADFGATNSFVGGVFTQTPSLVFNGAGISQLAGGTLTLLNGVIPNFQFNSGTVNLSPSFENGTITNLVLNQPGSSVSLSGSNYVTGQFTLSGNTTGPLVIAPGAVLTWNGGTIGGPLTISSNAVININAPNSTAIYLSASVTNAGIVNWNNGNIVEYSGNIYNQPGASFEINCDQSLSAYSSVSIFTNAGLVQKTAGFGTTQMSPIVQNTGTFDVQTGILSLISSTSSSDLAGFFLAEPGATIQIGSGGYLEGAYTASSGATISLTAGNFTYSPTAPLFNGPGTNLLVQNATITLVSNVIPNLQMNGGTVIPGPLFQGGTITNLNLGGSSLGGTNVVTGTLTTGGGQNTGTSTSVTGPLTIAPGATLNISSYFYIDAPFTNAGTVNWSNNYVYINYNGAIYNLQNAVFNAKFDGEIVDYYYQSGVFINQGLFRKIGTPGTAYVSCNFTNTGTVEVASGQLYFNGPALANQGGTFQADSGAILTFANGGSLTANYYAAVGGTIQLASGTFTNTTTTSFNGPGSYIMTGGSDTLLYGFITNLVLQGGSVIPGPLFQGGTITNVTLPSNVGLAGTNILSGTLTLSNGNITGPLTVNSGSTLNVNGYVSAPLTIASGATVSITGPVYDPITVASNSVLTILGSIQANIALAPGSTLNWGNGYLESPLTVPSNATLNIVGSQQIYFEYPLTNFGVVNWTSSPLYLYDNTAILNEPGAAFNIQNDNAIYAQATSGSTAPYFTNSGTITKSLTSGTNQIGVLFGNSSVITALSGMLKFTTTFTQSSGTWNLLLDGPGSNGQLAFSGTAPLSGTLNVAVNTNYVLGLGNSYALLNYGATNGAFSTINLPGEGATWQLAWGTNALVLNLTNLQAPVVNITAPANNAAFVIPANITVSASAVDSAASVSSVQFYNGTNFLGLGTVSGGNTFSYLWNSVPPGLYTLSALATDAHGALGTSAPVNIVVYSNHNPTTNFVWIGSASSDWFNPTNWAPAGVPGALDDATIANNSTVSLSHNTTVNNITFASGTLSGPGTLTVTNTFNWASGTISGSIAIATNGLLNISGASTMNWPGSTVLNNGTIVWTGGTLYGPTNTITNNGIFLVETDSPFVAGLVANNGIFRKTIATNSSGISYQTWVNNGSVDIETGSLTFQNGGLLTGSYNAATNATLAFNGFFTISNVPPFSGQGTSVFRAGNLSLMLDAPQNLQLAGGSVQLGPLFQNSGAITNLTILGATLTGTNTVTGSLNVPSGVLFGALTVAPGATLTLGSTNSSTQVSFQGSLVNSGTVAWIGGSLGYYYATYSITNNGLWLAESLNNYNELYYGTFINNGTLRKTGTNIAYVYPSTFVNNGLVDSQTGILNLGGTMTFSGTYNAAAGAQINFNSGTFTLAALPNLTGPGLFTVAQNGSGTTLIVQNDLPPNLQLGNATIQLGTNFQNAGRINNLTLTGGTLSGDYTVTGSLTLNGVTIDGSLTVNSNATLYVVTNGCYVNGGGLTNFGTVNWSGGTIELNSSNGAVNNGLWLAQGATTMELYGYSSPVPTFVNNGVFRVQVPVAYDVSVYGSLLFTNNGLVDVQSGTIYYEANGPIQGTYNTAAQGKILFYGGVYTNSGPVSFTGPGTNEFEYGTLNLFSDEIPSLGLIGGSIQIGSSFQNKGSITNLTLNGATLLGTNSVSGTLNFLTGTLQGQLTILSNGVLNLSGANTKTFNLATIINNGTVEWTGGVLSALYTNYITNNGLWFIQCDQTLTVSSYPYTNGYFINTGTVLKSGTLGQTEIFSYQFLNSGTIDVESGQLVFEQGAAYQQTGANLIFGASSPNLLGQLVLSTNISLDGGLTLKALNGYTPAVGDTLAPITYTAEAGNFAGVNLPALPSGEAWTLNYGSGGIHLSVVASNAVSTPSQLTGAVVSSGGQPVQGVTVYATASAPTNLVQNGSFEIPQDGNNSYLLYSPGSTNLVGWTVVGPTNVNVATSHLYGNSEDGNQYFDPTGTTGGGGITQNVPTTVGVSYLFSFYHGSANRAGYTAPLGVTLGSSNYTFGETSETSGNLDWRLVQIPFVATSNLTTIGFADLTGVDANDNFVDDVRIVPVSAANFFTSTTDNTGHYQIAVPNGVYSVGVAGLATAGYSAVPSQSPVTLSGGSQTVNFTPSPLGGSQNYTITTSASPAGAGAITATETVPSGTVVTLTAVANTNTLPYQFSSWTENGVVQSTNSTYVFTAIRNRALVANFILPGFLVAVSNNPAGAGVISGTGVYTFNATATLTAFPFYGYNFASWSENGSVLATTNPLTLTITTNRSLVANYTAANPVHLVTTTTIPGGIAAVSGAGTFTNNQSDLISAPAITTNSGTRYTFQYFQVGTNIVSTNASFTKVFTTVDQPNVQFVAVYASQPVTPQLAFVTANHANPVPATANFLLTFQFDRSMKSSPPLSILITNATPGATQPTVGNNGHWSTTTLSNDTYQSPPITISTGMDGTAQVYISGAQDTLGDVLPSTLATTIVISTKAQTPPSVTITAPTNGASFAAPASFTLSATASSAVGIQQVVFKTNGVVLGVASQTSSPYSIAVNNLPAGSYAITAVATDTASQSATSTPVHITVNNSGQTLIDFEAVDASQGSVGGATLNNYLAGYGVTLSNGLPSGSVVVANDTVFGGGNITRASSGDNFLTEIGANGPVSYTLFFSQAYASVGWVRPTLLAGATGVSSPAWTAHAFNASGTELGAIGEKQFVTFTNIPAAPFTLFGPGITSIRFDANNNGVSQLSSLPLDDLSLSTLATNTSLTIALSAGSGATLTAPGQVNLVAQVGDTASTPSEIDFYEGQNLLGSIAPGGAGTFTFPVNNLAAGSYSFTAVARDAIGASRTSTQLPITIQSASGINVINFDSAAAAANISNYLAGFGIGITNLTVGSHLQAISSAGLSVSATAVPSSPPNLLTQVGVNQPVSFTLTFATPAQSVSFTRVALLAGNTGISHPKWTATAFNAAGAPLASAAEDQIASSTNVPARTFQLAGSSIASIRFDSDSQQQTSFAALLLDDLVLNGNPIASPPLHVTLTSPSGVNTNFIAPAAVNLAATITDTLGTNAVVIFLAGSSPIATVSNSPYAYSWTNVPPGNYSLRAEIIDPSGLASFSAPVPITVSPGGNSAVVTFDSLDATGGPVTGSALATYLAAAGITASNLSPGTAIAVENQSLISGGAAVSASSPPNVLTQIGSNGPVSFTLGFANPLGQFSFTRPELLANAFVSHPAWTATAFDGSGTVLSSVNAALISSFTNVPAQIYTLTGPGIASIQFSSAGSGLGTFNALVLDDLLLTTNPATPPTVAITNPVTSQFFVAPATVEIDSTAASVGGIAQVNFFANKSLIGTASAPAAGNQFSILWTNSAVGAYSLTAVATANNGLSQTSAPVNMSIIPSPFLFGISQQPASQTVALGTVAFFHVVVTGGGSGGVSYQWFLNGTAVSGQSNATLTIFPVQNSSAGSYTVQVTSGGQTITSAPAVLTVAQPPTFTVLPQPQTLNVGQTISINGDASGTGPFTWQWLLNGTAVPGATNKTYVVQSAQPRDSGNYQLVVQSPLAFAKSPAVPVSVQVNNGIFLSADYFSNRITINPLLGPVMGSNTNATSETGEPLHDGKPGGKSIWYTWTASFTGVISLTTLGSDFDTLLAVYLGTNVSQLTPVASDDDSGGFFTSLVTFNVTQGATYQIAVDGFQGASGTVILGMPSPASYQVTTNSLPVILQGPTNQLVAPGGTLTLTVVASNAATYQWFFNSAPIAGATNSSFVITNFQASSVGLYSVLAANGSGSAQSEPASVQVAVQNAGSPASSQDKFGDAVDLSTTQSNGLPAIIKASGGDTRGFSVSQAFSTVKATKEPGEPDHCGQAGGASQWYIYTTPAAGSFHVSTAGSTFNTIVAVYTGSGADFASLTELGCGFTTNFQANGQPDVLIGNVAAGTKLFIVVDGYLGASGTVLLNIGLGQLPSIAALPQNQAASPGGSAAFNVVAQGSTNFSYQWLFNGVQLPKQTNATLSIANVQSNSLGSYSVVISNVVGVITSGPPAVLTIQSTPAINSQPTNLAATLGSSATFTAGAAGVAPLEYQWLFNGNPIARATNSSLTISPVTTAAVGSYSVVVTNSLGSVTSSNAVLTIRSGGGTPPAVTVAAPLNNTSTTSSTVKLSGTAAGKAGISLVQFDVNGTGFQPATGTTKWSATATLAPGTNVITVEAVDTNGLSSTHVVRNVIFTPPALLTVNVSPAKSGTVTSTTGAGNGKSLLIGKFYTLTAVPSSAINWIFKNWTAGTNAQNLSVFSTNASIKFTMATNLILQANFIANPFTPLAGTYNGLFSSDSGVAEQSAGFFTATIASTSTGLYSGNIALDGGTYPFTGTFDLTGKSQTTIKRAGKPSVIANLQLDFSLADNLLSGTLSLASNGGWTAVLAADRAVFNTKNPATNYSGQFTMVLPPATNSPVLSPGGFGYATSINSTVGSVLLAGVLGDGTAISKSTAVSQNGYVPVYVSLYAGKGSLQGWLTFTNAPPKDVSGTLTWIKPGTVANTLYPAGFTNNVEILGSPYAAPAAKQPVLNLVHNEGTLTIAQPGQALVFNVAFTNGVLVKTGSTPTNKLSVVIAPTTGIMTVTFRPRGARVDTVAQGIVLQNQATNPAATNAAGWFKGTNETSSFLLQ
jgi:hypothetical protein